RRGARRPSRARAARAARGRVPDQPSGRLADARRAAPRSRERGAREPGPARRRIYEKRNKFVNLTISSWTKFVHGSEARRSAGGFSIKSPRLRAPRGRHIQLLAERP